jgi:hypothetical protein
VHESEVFIGEVLRKLERQFHVGLSRRGRLA